MTNCAHSIETIWYISGNDFCFLSRRKREYAEQDLEKLLKAEKIETPMLMPKNPADGGPVTVKLNANRDDPAPFPAYLPLEIFDNGGELYYSTNITCMFTFMQCCRSSTFQSGKF